MTQKRLNNLDGLRFIAAWIVLACHIEVIKPSLGFQPVDGRFFTNAAQVAVTFFFVLSGFLISYLLLSEKKENPSGKIHVGHFYKKRVLRIWPLYYLLVILTFFVFNRIDFFHSFPGSVSSAPDERSPNRLIGYLLFLPNYVAYSQGSELYLGQTWSLGVEEFFYLFFPLGIYFTPLKYVRKFLVTVILLFLILSIGIQCIHPASSDKGIGYGLLSVYLYKYRIYSFAMGGMAAWWLIEKKDQPVQLLSWFTLPNRGKWMALFLLALLAGGITFSIATQQVYSVLFALFLFILIASNTTFSLLNNRVIIYLGKISYGIYMLHPLAIVIFLRWVTPGSGSGIGFYFLLLAGVTILTIGLAAISYELYEKFFLRFRK